MKKYLRGGKIAALLVILTGLAGSYFILKSPAQNGSSDRPIAFGFPKPSNAGFDFARKKDFLSPAVSEKKIQTAQTDNFTDNLIQNYLYEITKRNQNGLNGKNITLPPEKIFSDLLEEKSKQPINLSLYTSKDILVANDSPGKTVGEYLESLKTAEQKSFKNNKDEVLTLFEAIFAKNDPSKAYDYNNRLRNYVTSLLTVRVPRGWQDFHVRLINLQQKKIALFEGLAGVSSDPLKTIISVNYLEEIVKEDGALADFIKNRING